MRASEKAACSSWRSSSCRSWTSPGRQHDAADRGRVELVAQLHLHPAQGAVDGAHPDGALLARALARGDDGGERRAQPQPVAGLDDVAEGLADDLLVGQAEDALDRGRRPGHAALGVVQRDEVRRAGDQAAEQLLARLQPLEQVVAVAARDEVAQEQGGDEQGAGGELPRSDALALQHHRAGDQDRAADGQAGQQAEHAAPAGHGPGAAGGVERACDDEQQPGLVQHPDPAVGPVAAAGDLDGVRQVGEGEDGQARPGEGQLPAHLAGHARQHAGDHGQDEDVGRRVGERRQLGQQRQPAADAERFEQQGPRHEPQRARGDRAVEQRAGRRAGAGVGDRVAQQRRDDQRQEAEVDEVDDRRVGGRRSGDDDPQDRQHSPERPDAERGGDQGAGVPQPAGGTAAAAQQRDGRDEHGDRLDAPAQRLAEGRRQGLQDEQHPVREQQHDQAARARGAAGSAHAACSASDGLDWCSRAEDDSL